MPLFPFGSSVQQVLPQPPRGSSTLQFKRDTLLCVVSLAGNATAGAEQSSGGCGFSPLLCFYQSEHLHVCLLLFVSQLQLYFSVWFSILVFHGKMIIITMLESQGTTYLGIRSCIFLGSYMCYVGV